MNTHPRNGDRIFLLGNGPSLRETPLDLLKDEDTMAMNRIHLIYPTVEWRPTFFFMADYTPQNTPGYWQRCIAKHYGTPKYLWDKFRDGFADEEGVGEVPNTIWIPRCEKHHYYSWDNHEKRAQSWHLPELCTAIGGMSAMMQIAVLMGYEEIYLLGCDIGYTSDRETNHFHPNYSQQTTDKHEWDNQNNLYLHEVANRSSPIPIYNATIGGALEVYPRVKLEDIL